MQRLTPQDRAALLWKAANGKQSLTLTRAAEALGVGEGHAMAVIKMLLLEGPAIPLMADYKPNLSRNKTGQRKRGQMQAPPPERLNGRLEMPTAPRHDCEEGHGLKVGPEPFWAEMRPSRSVKPEYRLFYRLR